MRQDALSRDFVIWIFLAYLFCVLLLLSKLHSSLCGLVRLALTLGRRAVVGVAVDQSIRKGLEKDHRQARHLSFRPLLFYTPALQVARLGRPAPGVYPMIRPTII